MQMPRKVILPRRIKADTADSLIAVTAMLAPLLVMSAIADFLPPLLHKLSIIGIPGALLYVVFRDSIGRGTSIGKKWLRLQVVDLRTGSPCTAGRVWARNLTDLIPILNAIDFVLMCIDPRGQKIMDKILHIMVSDTPLRMARASGVSPVWSDQRK